MLLIHPSKLWSGQQTSTTTPRTSSSKKKKSNPPHYYINITQPPREEKKRRKTLGHQKQTAPGREALYICNICPLGPKPRRYFRAYTRVRDFLYSILHASDLRKDGCWCPMKTDLPVHPIPTRCAIYFPALMRETCNSGGTVLVLRRRDDKNMMEQAARAGARYIIIIARAEGCWVWWGSSIVRCGR